MVGGDFAAGIPAQNTFCENVRFCAGPSFESAGDDFFGMADAVNGGGVDPIDAEFKGAMNRSDGIRVILRAPSEFPAGPAGGPSAETNGGDLQIGIAKSLDLHEYVPPWTRGNRWNASHNRSMNHSKERLKNLL